MLAEAFDPPSVGLGERLPRTRLFTSRTSPSVRSYSRHGGTAGGRCSATPSGRSRRRAGTAAGAHPAEGDDVAKPGGRGLPFTAVEEFAAEVVAFVWRARFPLVRVLDRYANEEGLLEVRLLG